MLPFLTLLEGLVGSSMLGGGAGTAIGGSAIPGVAQAAGGAGAGGFLTNPGTSMFGQNMLGTMANQKMAPMTNLLTKEAWKNPAAIYKAMEPFMSQEDKLAAKMARSTFQTKPKAPMMPVVPKQFTY